MKKMSQSLTFIGIVLLAMAMLSACATAPQEQPKGDAGGQTPGLYKNEEYRFTAEYPDNFKTKPPQGKLEIFRAEAPTVVPVFTVTIEDAEADAKLDTNVFIESAEKKNPGSKRFKVLSEDMVTLNDGTPGLALTYKWTWTDGTTKLQTATMWFLKDGKGITVNATTILGGPTTPDKLMAIVSTLKFY